MRALGRARGDQGEIWPGFVDALSSLLIIVLFVVMVFMVAQFFLTNQLSGQERAIERLNAAIAQLADALSLKEQEAEAAAAERDRLRAELQATMSLVATLEAEKAELESQRATLRSQLATATSEREELESRLATVTGEREALASELSELEREKQALASDIAGLRSEKEALEGEVTGLRRSLGEQESISQEALDQVMLLNQQIAALRRQLAAVQQALDAAEQEVASQRIRIADLGRRLNVALAAQVEELKQYRSEFFGRLREVLGERSDIRIVGDRFVFQSELLFPTGQARLTVNGREQLARLAGELVEIADEIPDDIDWILQVEGHTDKRPIRTFQFPSNWELSTARATAVVKFLTALGIPPHRLSANGYGEHHPIAEGDSEEAWAKNRRIELKFTQR